VENGRAQKSEEAERERNEMEVAAAVFKRFNAALL
jgi:hypothetical protein